MLWPLRLRIHLTASRGQSSPACRRAERRTRQHALAVLVVDLDLVRLHRLLDGGADVFEPDVDAGLADAGVGRVADGLEEAVVRRLKIERKGRVDDAARDVDADVDLEHVGLLEHCATF